MRTCYTGQVSLDQLDQTVTLFGWVHRRRDHGGVIFIDLRDREGIAQIVFDPDNAQAFAIAEEIRNEYCIRITGLVRRRLKAPPTRSWSRVKSKCCAAKLKCLMRPSHHRSSLTTKTCLKPRA